MVYSCSLFFLSVCLPPRVCMLSLLCLLFLLLRSNSLDDATTNTLSPRATGEVHKWRYHHPGLPSPFGSWSPFPTCPNAILLEYHHLDLSIHLSLLSNGEAQIRMLSSSHDASEVEAKPMPIKWLLSVQYWVVKFWYSCMAHHWSLEPALAPWSHTHKHKCELHAWWITLDESKSGSASMPWRSTFVGRKTIYTRWAAWELLKY